MRATTITFRAVKLTRTGKGSFGEVFKGLAERKWTFQLTSIRYEKRSGIPVAIKIVDLESSDDEIDDIQCEIQILAQMDSAYVTR